MPRNGASSFDVAIVGGRCAGAVLALRLARDGARVVIVDRDEIGTDTLSTHTVFPNTLARLDELGVLEPLLERHDVPMLRYRFSILGREAVGAWTPVEGFDTAMAPRRTALDPILAEAALEAGAEGRYGQRVTGLIGTGEEGDPVRGVELGDGQRIEARWTVGADGRASSVARKLGIEDTRPMAGDMAMLLGYWRGLPETDIFHLDMKEDLGITLIPCEDGVQLLVVSGPPELTRGGPEVRDSAYQAAVRQFPETIDPGAIEEAELITEVRAAPETMLRGFFRRPTGPGWALVGDAGHFKHPATAQGISDAIEQAIFLAEALGGEGNGLDGYEAWRDERAAGFYEFSFQFGTLPSPETAGPIFDGILAEPNGAQDLRDTMSRQVRPDTIFSSENFKRWFAAAGTA